MVFGFSILEFEKFILTPTQCYLNKSIKIIVNHIPLLFYPYVLKICKYLQKFTCQCKYLHLNLHVNINIYEKITCKCKYSQKYVHFYKNLHVNVNSYTKICKYLQNKLQVNLNTYKNLHVNI